MSTGRFVWTRWKQLLIPASVLVGFAFVLGNVVGWVDPDPGWLDRALLLIVSPLWFLVVYLVVILVSPLAIRAHQRWGELVPVFMVAATALTDVGRFAEDADRMALLNLVVVWALCFQLGFFYERLASAPRRSLWVVTWGGFFSLVALVRTGLYPLSMVGVPGDKFSNMAPPTLCIVALCFFQVGVAMLLRPVVLGRLDRPRWSSFSRFANRYAMGIFLWHTTGFAFAYALVTVLGLQPPQQATIGWWATRPIWLLLPALFTLPLVLGFDRLMGRRVGTGRPDVTVAPDLAVPRSELYPECRRCAPAMASDVSSDFLAEGSHEEAPVEELERILDMYDRTVEDLPEEDEVVALEAREQFIVDFNSFREARLRGALEEVAWRLVQRGHHAWLEDVGVDVAADGVGIAGANLSPPRALLLCIVPAHRESLRANPPRDRVHPGPRAHEGERAQRARGAGPGATHDRAVLVGRAR